MSGKVSSALFFDDILLKLICWPCRNCLTGAYFGFYTIEEAIDENWAVCFGIDPDAAFEGERRDPAEVSVTTLLKADHGGGGGWPERCGHGGCADGFERKMPDCKGCDNDFIMRNPGGPDFNGVDNVGCQCDNLPELDAMFQRLRSDNKAEVAGVMNLTAAFLYQAMLVINANIDSGDHNYYIYKQPSKPWAVVNIDSDWGWGAGFLCGEPGVAMWPGDMEEGDSGPQCVMSACRENGAEDGDCCAGPGQGPAACAHGFTPTSPDSDVC